MSTRLSTGKVRRIYEFIKANRVVSKNTNDTVRVIRRLRGGKS